MLFKSSEADQVKMANQAAMIALAILYTRKMAAYQMEMTGGEKYAKSVIDNARLFGLKPPRGKMTQEKILLVSIAAKGIGRIHNQASQVIIHHDDATNIFQEFPRIAKGTNWDDIFDSAQQIRIAAQKYGYPMDKTPEPLQQIIYANREDFNLDNFDYPRGDHFLTEFADGLYQNKDKSILAVYCEKAEHLGVRRMTFYPTYRDFLNAPPPERKKFFSRGGDHALVGSNGIMLTLKQKDRVSLRDCFRGKNVACAHK